MKKLHLLLLFVAVMVASSAMAIVQPVHWSYTTETLSKREVMVTLHAEIKTDWHLYSQHQEGMALPLVFTWPNPDGFEPSAKKFWKESVPYTESYDPILKDTERYFSGSVDFSTVIKRADKEEFIALLKVEAQACANGSCVPVIQTIEINVPAYDKAEVGQLSEVIDAPYAGPSNNMDALPAQGEIENHIMNEADNQAVANNALSNATVASNSVANPATSGVTALAGATAFSTDLGAVAESNSIEDTDNQVTANNQENKAEVENVVDASENAANASEEDANASENTDLAQPKEEASLWWFFLLAFAGGLLGILTPCVFPMIPMTVSYFMKHGGKKQALFYGFSIVFIYVLVGIILSAIFGQDFANIISTHWIPNLLFAVIFLIFALSLFGYFEISLPSKWVNKSAGLEAKAGYVGTFFMAFTLVLVSFSCTLPIAGAVALQSADGSFVKPIIGMLGFSLAFALPFTFFAFFPQLLKKMPKSGGWMNTLKVSLAFVEVAFALKFISVPDQVYHWGILDREIFLAFWIVIFFLWGLYLIGAIRFPLDDKVEVQKSPFRFSLAVLVFTFVVYMIPGMWGAPLNALSGWLPPMSTQDFVMQPGADHSLAASTCGPSKYADQLHASNGIQAYFDYDEAIACAKKQNKPVFLDFTGHGCVNCRRVEQNVFSQPDIQKVFAEEMVVAALYVDDRVVKLPEFEPFVTAEGDTLRMLGEKNRYIQNTKFRENSQPCYILLDPFTEEPIYGPIFYETNPARFMEFLQEGLRRF